MAIYTQPQQYEQEAVNNQQAKNKDRADAYANSAQQGQYPNAAEGSQIAQVTGAASAGATAAKAPPPAQPQQTFAQMQAAGYARPAPPPAAAPVPAPGTPTPGNLSEELRRQVMAQFANPDPRGEENYQRQYASGARGIEDDFQRRRVTDDEELARRGVFDSSIAAGRYGDTNLARRSAEVELQDRLAQQQAGSYAANRQAAIGHGFQYEALNAANQAAIGAAASGNRRLDLEQARFDREGKQYDREFDYRSGKDTGDRDFDYQQWLGLNGVGVEDPGQYGPESLPPEYAAPPVPQQPVSRPAEEPYLQPPTPQRRSGTGGFRPDDESEYGRFFY